jgi:uncharacterized SAM-binding protein YcdF (DUF218 family)
MIAHYMDTLLALKPILTTLVMPASSGLLALASLVAWAWASRIRTPLAIAIFPLTALWLLSCPAIAVWLSANLIPQVSATTPEQLLSQRVQAIVILGGGVENNAPEYDAPTLANASMARLLYGAHLAKATQIPLAYSGGIGWVGSSEQMPEARVAAQALERMNASKLRWQDSLSRDTRENAEQTAQMLRADNVQRIALVTHAWHMPRSIKHFEAAGLIVTPAPMGFIRSDLNKWLQWLPNAGALNESTLIIRERLGLLLM